MLNHSRLGLAIRAAHPWIVSDSASGSNTSWPNRIAQAIPGGDPGQYLITTRYIDSLRDMTRTSNSKVIFMPVETSAMLSSIGAIKEVLSQTGEQGGGDKEIPPPPRPRELPR